MCFPPDPLRTLPLKPSRNTNPKGPCPPQPASWLVRHFWNLGASSLFPLTESCTHTHTLIHLPFLSACAFLLQRASSFRSVLEGAAPPPRPSGRPFWSLAHLSPSTAHLGPLLPHTCTNNNRTLSCRHSRESKYPYGPSFIHP